MPKISSLCDVPSEAVITCPDVGSLYEIPLILQAEGLDGVVCEQIGFGRDFGVGEQCEALGEWRGLVDRIRGSASAVRVGIIGKYVSLPDAYLSVTEALRHAAIHHDADISVDWVPSESVDDRSLPAILRDLDAIVLPGGFGERGVEGKIAAAGYARRHRIPCLGLCLGMQVMAIEYARNALGLEGANSTEFESATPHPVIDLMEGQRDVAGLGGTMRLGAYVAQLGSGSRVARAYGAEVVSERHRHRYEFNPKYHSRFQEPDSEVVLSGFSPDGRLVEFIELEGHPFWIGTQAHPEFKSRPTRPAPLFRELVGEALRRAEGRNPRLLDIDMTAYAESGL